VVKTCPCGCGRSPLPKRKYADYERCRQRAYKQRVKTVAEARGLETRLSLKRLEGATRTGGRSGYAENGRKAHRKRSPRHGVAAYWRDPVEAEIVLGAALLLLDDASVADPLREALTRHRSKNANAPRQKED
jgi:hypothetical protein